MPNEFNPFVALLESLLSGLGLEENKPEKPEEPQAPEKQDQAPDPVVRCWETKEPEEQDQASSPVEHPKHYTTGEIEVIDYIRDKLQGRDFTSYCLGNVIKYVSRWREKGGVEDLEKAYVYLGWAITSARKEGA